MTPNRRTGLCSLGLALLAATTSTAALADADARLRVFGYGRAAPVETVPESIVDDWKYLDDAHVMVFRRGQAYLLEMSGSCPALQTAGVIAFNAALSGLVAAKTLVVGGRTLQTECGVSRIIQLQRLPASAAPPPAPAPRPRASSVPPATPAPAPAPDSPAPTTPAPTAPAPTAPAPPVPAPPAEAPMPPPAASPPPPPATTPPPRIEYEVKPPPGATPL